MPKETQEDKRGSESALIELLADLPMNKQQAIKAMKLGKKVTHRDFTPDEWIADNGLKYEFEDGCSCSYNEFWKHRVDDAWNEGWKIYS